MEKGYVYFRFSVVEIEWDDLDVWGLLLASSKFTVPTLS